MFRSRGYEGKCRRERGALEKPPCRIAPTIKRAPAQFQIQKGIIWCVGETGRDNLTGIDVLAVARKQRYAILLEKLRRGETLSAYEIRELEGFDTMAGKPKKKRPSTKAKVGSKEMPPVELARHQRHLDLLRKIKDGKGLTPREQKELEGYEDPGEDQPPQDERATAAKRMAKKRAVARDIAIDFSRQDMNRRRRCRNPKVFLKTYFPDIFYLPFSRDQGYIIEQAARCIRQGGMKAIAAPRGGGKTTYGKGMVIWGFCYGYIKWVAWIEANAELAESSVEDIKLYYEDKHDKDYFRDDFPEFCDPIRALDGETRRARLQTYNGNRTRIFWGTGKIVLPTVEGTEAMGGIIQAFGAEKPIRGLVRQAIRPDLAIINDIETEETAKSLAMTESIQKNIEKAVKGLAGHGRKKMGVMLLCTILRRGCLADKFTDPNLYPQWAGMRQKFLVKPPDNRELWDQYIYKRKKDQRDGLPNGPNATAFYRKNRKAMDAGAVVGNKHWFDPKVQLSALQNIFDLISDMGDDNFNCEYQNEPPEDISTGEAIPPDRVCEKISGVERGSVPAGVEKITAFVDVHNQKLFWAIVAWKQGLIGYVIDYGVDKTTSPTPGEKTQEEADAAVDIAIYDGLVVFRNRISAEYQPSLCLVDSGYRPAPVFRFCRESVGWRASKGGSGSSGVYTTPKPDPMIPVIGQGYHVSILPQFRQRLVVFDPDRFKKLVQEGFLLKDVQGAGSLSLFGDEPTIHRAYSEHIAAEQWDAGKKKFVKVPGKNHNHWLDCTVGCMVAAALCGIKLVGATKVPENRRVISETKLSVGIRTNY